ncbi:SAM-dependent methyltransferase [Prauserella oleivorans]
MALPVHTTESPDQPGYDGPELPGIAQINDYWLDGDHHEPADRELADKFAVVAPHIPYLVRTQRALLGRIVRHLTELGITQFLDLGSGIPTCGHVHELAPSASVVYVDNDPRVVAVARDVLAGTGNAVLLDEDLREPDRVLARRPRPGCSTRRGRWVC